MCQLGIFCILYHDICVSEMPVSSPAEQIGAPLGTHVTADFA